jgi:hypothetical protein
MPRPCSPLPHERDGGKPVTSAQYCLRYINGSFRGSYANGRKRQPRDSLGCLFAALVSLFPNDFAPIAGPAAMPLTSFVTLTAGASVSTLRARLSVAGDRAREAWQRRHEQNCSAASSAQSLLLRSLLVTLARPRAGRRRGALLKSFPVLKDFPRYGVENPSRPEKFTVKRWALVGCGVQVADVALAAGAGAAAVPGAGPAVHAR